MKLNFKDVNLELIDGSLQPFPDDAIKMLANNIYNNTKDIGMFEIARKIYNLEEIEVTAEQEEELRNTVNNSFVVLASTAINRYIDSKKPCSTSEVSTKKKK